MKKARTSFVRNETCWESAPVPCLVLDRKGRIVTANPAAAQLFDQDRTHLSGLEIKELFSPTRRLYSRLRSQKALRSGEEIEGKILRQNTPLRVGIQLQPWTSSASRPTVLAWLKDRSETHELRARLERSEKLSAMAIVAGKVAHEIRTPLNSIFLNNDLLQEKVDRMRGQHGQSLRRYIKVLQEEVGRLNEIVASYLSLSRLAGGDRQQVRVESFLKNFIAEVREEYAQRRIEIVTAFRARPVLISLNQRQLRRVLLNLFSNSRDAIKNGGVITVSTEDSPHGYRITISDNGEGIPPEALSRLTTPFTSLKENGSGLGLYLAQEIIRHHGGRMEIQSLQGEGTSVILTLSYENA
jgi:PAS domain S-box-containing protein